MATCRECANCICIHARCLAYRYEMGIEQLDEPLEEDEGGMCRFFKSRPKPLEDELAEALNWLLHLHHGVSKGGNDPETGQPYPVTDGEWKAAIAEGMRVHACYAKEQADATGT